MSSVAIGESAVRQFHTDIAPVASCALEDATQLTLLILIRGVSSDFSGIGCVTPRILTALRRSVDAGCTIFVKPETVWQHLHGFQLALCQVLSLQLPDRVLYIDTIFIHVCRWTAFNVSRQ
jgi:hypothetical protein